MCTHPGTLENGVWTFRCGHSGVITERYLNRIAALALIAYSKKMGTGNVLLSIEQAEALL